MPTNDVILLDSLRQKNKPLYGTRDDESEYFELFSIDNVLKNFDLSLDELEDGWVDDSDDGGIDGFYVFVDGIRLADNRNPISDLDRTNTPGSVELKHSHCIAWIQVETR